MKLVEILQGKWLGHPLHPAIVHVPLGLWFGACVLDILVRAGIDTPALPHLAFYAVAVGLLGVLIAAPSGLADWSSVKRERPAWKLGLYHLILNLAATAIFAINLWLRFKRLDEAEPISTAILITSLVGTLVVTVSGYLGSLLAFDHGISVARLSKSKWRAEAEKGGARLPKET